MSSAFEHWFLFQFGPRSRSEERDSDLVWRIESGDAARREMDRRLAWDRQKTAALYGWQISDKDRQKWAEQAAAHGGKT